MKYNALRQHQAKVVSLSARRAWIEISDPDLAELYPHRRSPQGERGLKSGISGTGMWWTASLSARRAWIEIPNMEIAQLSYWQSLSARRAWIEIALPVEPPRRTRVALRKESVD